MTQPRPHLMDAALQVDPSLHDDQPVYRTLDFFAAAHIITSGELRFSRADTFSDPNEGIDHLFRQLEVSGSSDGCGGMGWNDAPSAREQHQRVKKSHFISCWTQTPESVATWLTYSPDTNGVRLSTTVGKLRQTLSNLLEDWSVGRLTADDIGKEVIISVSGRIAPVRYEPLPAITKRINRRVRAYQRIRQRYRRRGQEVPSITGVDPRYYIREQQREITKDLRSCSLKDSSYSHEHELRVTARFGEEKCDQKVFEKEQAFLEPASPYHVILNSHLSAWGFVSDGGLPPFLFAKCPSPFVDAVALDPRCPPHRAAFIAQWFQQHNITVAKSHCFGYIPESFDVYPTW